MYAVVIKFKVKSGSEDDAKAKAWEILESFKGVKGFLGAVIYSDEETSEWCRTIVWETKEDQLACKNVLSPESHAEALEMVDGAIETMGYNVVGYVTASS